MHTISQKELAQDVVGNPNDTKWGLKYVMFSQVKKRKKRLAPSDCSELMGANIFVYAANVYLVIQLG